VDSQILFSAAHDRLDRRLAWPREWRLGLLAPIRLGRADWLLNLNRAFLLNDRGARSF
jgi:hypothetical protein